MTRASELVEKRSCEDGAEGQSGGKQQGEQLTHTHTHMLRACNHVNVHISEQWEDLETTRKTLQSPHRRCDASVNQPDGLSVFPVQELGLYAGNMLLEGGDFRLATTTVHATVFIAITQSYNAVD